MLTLFALAYFSPPVADQSDNNPAPQGSSLVATSDTKPIDTGNYYHGVLVTKQDLMGMLEQEFTTYGLEDQIPLAKRVIECESGWNIHADNGISFGVAQFTQATWKDFGSGDIFNPIMQFHTMARMWAKGLQKRWDCYRLLTSK